MNEKIAEGAKRAPRSGTVEPKRDKSGHTIWCARILLKDGSRKRLVCRTGLTREQAEKDAAKWQAREDLTHELYNDKMREKGKAVDGESSDRWFRRMMPLRIAQLKTSDGEDLAYIWGKWVSPHIGPVPIASLTRADVIKVRDALDEAQAANRIGARTALNAWSCLRSALKVACSTKGWARELKVLDADPSIGVEPPDSGPTRLRQWIYPSELAAVFKCPSIPLARKRTYILASYTGLRPGELAELRWKDCDFVAGVIRVNRAIDLERGKKGTPKTFAGIRVVPMEPALRPALEAWKGEPEDLVAPYMTEIYSKSLAGYFRADLAQAGIKDARLSETTATHRRADFRCLRDSYATHQILAGLSVEKLRGRMGHTDFATSLRYAKVAETVSDVGVPFGPLPPEVYATGSATISQTTSFSLRPHRESNPGYQRERLMS